MRIRQSVLAAAIAIATIGCGSNTNDGPQAGPAAQASPATQGDVPERLRSTIAATLKVDESRVTPNASFAKDLGANELSMVELVMAYEREFKVDISDAEADRFQQVKDVADYLRRHNAVQ